MNIQIQNINFKGYDAVPLKSLYVDSEYSEPYVDELETIAKEEHFSIKRAEDHNKWNQDNKCMIEKYGKPYMICYPNIEHGYLTEIYQRYGMKGEITDDIYVGGNSFFGKYPNGKKWVMVGIHDFLKYDKKRISKKFGVEEQNFKVMPQQNYHLDMFLRPIGYPYVLLDDPKLTSQKLLELEKELDSKDFQDLKRNFEEFEQSRKKDYDDSELTAKFLEKEGFKVIKVAGVWGSGINFMNAIINKHDNGTISYITNSTKCKSPVISKIQEIFEKDLREKVPNLDKIYFVHGKDEYMEDTSNFMMDELSILGGGIHCMTLEEPNFDTWG